MPNDIHHPFSPSRLERFALCPGAHHLCLNIPETSSPEAQEGRLLHKAAEEGKDGETYKTLTADQQMLVDDCLRIVDLYAPFGSGKVSREVELSMVDEAFNVLTSGTADLIVEHSDHVVVADWKMGRIPVTNAHENIQLRAYAAMAAKTFSAASVKVIVHQPRIKKTTEAVFDSSDFDFIVEQVKGIVKACETGTMLCYGEIQCRYCTGKAVCPEYQRNQAANTTELAKYERASAITNPELLGDLLNKWKAVEKFGESLEHHAKKLLMGDVAIPGWELKSTRGKRVAKEPQKIFEKVSGVVDQAEFLGCVSLSLTELDDVYARNAKAKLGVTLKDAKKQLAEIIADDVERKGDGVQLVRKDY